MNQSIELAPQILKVPERWRGKIQFKWPQKLPDGSTSFGSNTETAAHIIVDAKTPEELAVATAICDIIIETEVDLAMQSILNRIDNKANDNLS